MNPIHIDLNDYVRTGEGANGASYNHKTDPNIMMKMYFRNFEAAALELELAKKVYALGIPTPEPGDLVTDGERMGIRFKRIEGKKSYSRACGDNPEKAEEGTIRKLYAESVTKNAVHASDSPANAAREIAIFFSEAEIIN